MAEELDLPTVLRRKLPPNLEKIKYGHYERCDLDYPIYLYLKEHDLRVTEDGSDVIEFLRGKNILVTGATGFLGKLLVEKLLRCCKDIGKIYIIIRNKKGKDAETRLSEYLNDWVFKKLSHIDPNYKEKVIGLSGDFELDELGLSEESRNIIKNQVNIIYHVAATVRFDEKLKNAVKINVRGTLEMIRLAKGCEKLDIFVYVSTAFSNCHKKVINEEFYPPHMDPYEIMSVTETLSADVVDRITPMFLGPAPNTYAFTKQITEDLVRRESVGIPTCIHRPSIVIASAKEPVRSWIDNIYGPVGLVLGTVLGLVHVMPGKRNGISDLVPADYVINSCIASSYQAAKERNTETVQIFNYTSSKENPILWRQFYLLKEQGLKVGSERMLIRGFSQYTACHYWYLLLNFLLHTIPAKIADFVAVQMGKKPVLGKVYAKINKFSVTLSYFTLNEWTIDNTNTTRCWESLNATDKKNFPFDMKSLEWQDYFDTYWVAMRELLVKDFLDTLEEGRRHSTRLGIIHYAAMAITMVLSIYYLINTMIVFIPVTIISVIMVQTFTDI